MLDATPLGLLANARAHASNLARLDSLLAKGLDVYLPEVADYEVRRNFILHNLNESISELDRLKRNLIYTPLTTSIMLRAAEMWAEARRSGKPTADRQALDCDVILAAQAIEVGAIVVTENERHLSRYVPTVRWQEIPIE